MSLIKPIETKFKGYRFRSRSEARWAVFLDALKVSFQYEAEGYDLDGSWYLPDFWIPSWDTFIEIKNHEFSNVMGDAFALCAKLAEKTAKNVLLINGVPPNYSMIAWDREGYEPSRFSQCRKCTAIYVENFDGSNVYALAKCDPGCTTDKWPTPGGHLTAALEAAQQARFEHGEAA